VVEVAEAKGGDHQLEYLVVEWQPSDIRTNCTDLLGTLIEHAHRDVGRDDLGTAGHRHAAGHCGSRTCIQHPRAV
jgi:hypothetical protein